MQAMRTDLVARTLNPQVGQTYFLVEDFLSTSFPIPLLPDLSVPSAFLLACMLR